MSMMWGDEAGTGDPRSPFAAVGTVSEHQPGSGQGPWAGATRTEEWEAAPGTVVAPRPTAVGTADRWGAVEEAEHGVIEHDEFLAFFEREGGAAGVACTFPSGVRLQVVSGATGPDQEHWDPNSSGEPLYDTGSAHRSARLSTNFVVKELASSGATSFDNARISCQLVTCLQRIRDRVAMPVTVTSGYRSWQYNVDLYRRKGTTPTKSQHCSGRAADISIGGMRGIDIAKLALRECGTEIGIGVADTWVHIDVRGAFAVWTYFSGADNDRVVAEVRAYRDRRRQGEPKLQTIVDAGRYIQSEYGYTVSEHPAFGEVNPVHSQGSYHYRNLAIDVNSRGGTTDAEKAELNALAGELRERCVDVRELLHPSNRADHQSHLHLAMGK